MHSAVLMGCVMPSLPVAAQSWSRTGAPTNAWSAAAASADGSRLAAVCGYPGDAIYTSADYGATWVSNNAPAIPWTAVASSADGAKLVAAGGGAIYTNSGTAWALAYAAPKSGPSYEQNIAFVATSADGGILVAASSFGDPIYSPKPIILVSTNAGATWTSATNSPSDGQGWTAVASSADGSKLAASTLLGGYFASVNAGATWSSNTVAPFRSLAMSADGNRLAGATPVGLFSSANGGATWAPLVSAPAMTNRVACSTNGLVLFGLAKTNIYCSFNAGTNWLTNSAPAANWSAIAVSKNGLRGVASVAGGGLYTLNPPPLQLASSNQTVNLLWSANYTALGVSLVQSTNLAGANWTAVPGVPGVDGAMSRVSIPATNRQQFFRLQSP